MSEPLMRTPTKGMSIKKQAAIVFLSRGYTIAQTAREIEVSEQAIHNWKTDKAFVYHLMAETKAHLTECRTRLGSLVQPAIDTLSSLLQADNPNIQLKAVQLILSSNGLDALEAETHMLLGMGIDERCYEV